MANTQGSSVCSLCDPGTYQKASGATECHICLQGSYCPAGASAPLPCDEGSFSSNTDNDDASDCTTADAGTFAPTGSVVQTDCAAGTIAAVEGLGACDLCPAGKFQKDTGETTCVDCTPGYYCKEGAAAALPCPGGTHKDASLTVMTSDSQCIICPERPNSTSKFVNAAAMFIMVSLVLMMLLPGIPAMHMSTGSLRAAQVRTISQSGWVYA